MEGKLGKIEFGIYEIPLKLGKGLGKNLEYYQEKLIRAQRRLLEFAKSYGWEKYMEPAFAKEAEIYSDKEKFDRRLKKLCKIDEDIKLPKTFSAALEEEIFTSVSPDLYLKNYPDGEEQDFFEKLITHEMAHRLHIRILDGDEEAMGPVWFFEGFAIFAAGQFSSDKKEIKAEELSSIINNPERISYRKYGKVIRSVTEYIDLRELVQMASEPDFNERVGRIVNR